MLRLAYSCLFLILVFISTTCYAEGLSLGLGYPYASLRYDFGGLALEGRYISDPAVQAYTGRTYFNYFHSDSVTGFAGLEGGYIKFDALNLKGTGVEGAVFLGGEFFISKSLSLLMDFAPTYIKLESGNMSANSVEYVVNLALYIHFGDGSGSKAYSAKNIKAIANLSEDDFSSPEMYKLFLKLGSIEPVDRREAAHGLGKAKEKAAVGALLKLLNDENEQVCGVVALSLGWIGDRQALTPLVYKLGDKSVFVRAAAAKALGYLADSGAEQPLENMLEDSSPQVRKVAEESLGIVRRSKKMRQVLGDIR